MPSDGVDPGRASHRALRGIRDELARHPAIEDVRGRPLDDLFTELRATVDSLGVGVAAPTGTLTVRWYAGRDGERPRFVFHYAGETGFDCGWHHHEQAHVDGWGHYQERASEAAAYRYESYEFGSVEPSRVVWEVLEALAKVLEQRDGR